MIHRRKQARRPGSIIPLLAVGLVGVFGFMALAIDLGLIMVARNQCQAAADSAAMAGARTLNGDPTTTNNSANAVTAATNAAAANQILSQQIPNAGVTVNLG